MITISRTYRASVEQVWKALTDIDLMRKWYFPMLDDFKPEVGFTTTFEAGPEGSPYLHRWIVTEAAPNKTIAYKWLYPQIEGDSTLRFEIEQDDNRTKLTLTHIGIESFQANEDANFAPESFKGGWTHFATALGEFLENDEALS